MRLLAVREDGGVLPALDLLLLNQFPDKEADQTIGRKHFVITLGRRKAGYIYTAFLALVMLAGTFLRKPGFGFVYTAFLKPRRLVAPDVLRDNPEPHRFAQGMGGSVLLLSILGFILGILLMLKPHLKVRRSLSEERQAKEQLQEKQKAHESSQAGEQPRARADAPEMAASSSSAAPSGPDPATPASTDS